MMKTQEMIDAIRKGDRLGHKAMQSIADKLELFERDNIHIRRIAENREQAVHVLKEEQARLNSVLREIAHSTPCRCLYMGPPMDAENLPPTVTAFALQGMTK